MPQTPEELNHGPDITFSYFSTNRHFPADLTAPKIYISSFDPRSGEAQPVCSHCSSRPFSLCHFQPPKSHQLRFNFTLLCSAKLPKSYLKTASLPTQFHYHIIHHSSPQDREKQEAKFPAIKPNLWNEGRREFRGHPLGSCSGDGHGKGTPPF